MSIYSSNRKMRKHSRSQPGHLRLSAYEESTALVVHIFEARGLMRRDSSALDVYVKLYLLPDPQKSTKKKTKTLRAQDPVFNQKFTFLLTETDAEKRLFISVWTPHITSRNVMIGCMSFLVADLVGPDKGLNGWYQLLDEEKGSKENQPVPVSISRQEGLRHLAVNQRPGPSEIAVTVSRGENGYGFDVRGYNPVYVTSVEHGASAAQADVRVGDAVVRVNNTDVKRANADLVQNLITTSGHHLQLILSRENSEGSMTTVTHSPPPPLPLLPTPPPLPHAAAATTSPSHHQWSTHSLPRSHRYPAHSSLHSRRHHSTTLSPHHPHPPLSTSVSYGALSQDAMSLLGARSSHQYSSLSHLPRGRVAASPPAAYGSSDILSRPVHLTGFEYNQQDQFVHEATLNYRSTHSVAKRPPHMHSVYEDVEDETEEEGVAWNPARQPVPERRERVKERRKRRGSGEELTQPSHPTRFHPPLSSSMFSFSQPGEPEMKTTHTLSQADLTHQWAGPGRGEKVKRVEKDAMTGERRHSRASFSPHRHGNSYHYRGNVELIGHQPLTATRSHGYSTEYGNGTGMRGTVPFSRIGMGPVDGSWQVGNEMDEAPLDWESLSPTERKRQKVLQSLVETESTFCSVLKNGIETYLEPLRTIVSESIHSTLFCNLKELYAISTKVEQQLKQRRLPYMGGATRADEATPYYITHVADIYHFQLPELLSLLRGYLDNLHSAKQELSVAFTNEAFAHLVQKSMVEGMNRSIYSFIEAGKDYVTRLFRCLLGAYHCTAATDVDQSYLSTSLRQLARICPDKETVKRWEDELKVMQRFEVCISFAPKIPKIPILVPGRVFVKEGEAQLIENKGKTKVWVILFSDILLIAQRRRGSVLTCLEPAIPLAKLRVDNFNCSEDTECQITNTEGSLIRLLRWPSVSDKSAWMASIKERATGSFQRRHGERRISKLPSQPPDPVSVEEEERNGHTLTRKAPTGRPPPPPPSSSGSKLLTQPEDTGVEGSREGRRRRGGGGGGGKRMSQQLELPDLGLGPAGVAAEPPPWKRSTSKRRSFNLFGGKGNKEKKKKDKKQVGELPSPGVHPAEEEITLYSVPPETLREWRKSLDIVLQHPAGRVLFHRHLAMEHSMENMQFCKAVDQFKTLPDSKLEKEAKAIVATYVGEGTPKQLNIDASVVKKVEAQLRSPHREMFDEARQTVYDLMAHDTFRRFKTSPDYIKASQRDQQHQSPPTT